MFENFQLAVIIKQSSRTRLLRIPLHQPLQEKLAESWHTQYDAFVEDIQEVEFDAGYQPEEYEHFYLSNYSLPDWLAGENAQTIPDLDAIGSDDALIDSIKGTVAFVRNDEGEELILFQNFTRSQVIRPGRFLFLEKDTYSSTKRPGLMLDKKLSAVYQTSESKLLFHSFRTVNTFLPLSDFYKEASEREIREVLDHELLAPEDPDVMADGASQWFRKRFAMLKDSGVLDQFSATEIQSRSEGHNVSIQISNDRIIFPADKPAAKKLLQFLNEELFRGAITDRLYETNSKREAD